MHIESHIIEIAVTVAGKILSAGTCWPIGSRPATILIALAVGKKNYKGFGAGNELSKIIELIRIPGFVHLKIDIVGWRGVG